MKKFIRACGIKNRGGFHCGCGRRSGFFTTGFRRPTGSGAPRSPFLSALPAVQRGGSISQAGNETHGQKRRRYQGFFQFRPADHRSAGGNRARGAPRNDHPPAGGGGGRFLAVASCPSVRFSSLPALRRISLRLVHPAARSLGRQTDRLFPEPLSRGLELLWSMALIWGIITLLHEEVSPFVY